MAITSVEEHVEALLNRRLAEAKSGGAPSPELEARSVFEVIALNLLLNPRVVLYTALLARNKLLKIALEELSLIDAIEKDILDLSNQSFIIKDVSDLEKARVALLQLETTQRLSTSAVTSFESAIESFLNRQLARNIRKSDSGQLTRPAPEAKADLLVHYSGLKDKHLELLSRLYSLAVGVDNFLALPTSIVLGMSTVTRIREDVESAINTLSIEGGASESRNLAIKLLADRAVLKTINNKPDPMAVDLPTGYIVRAKSSGKAFYTRSGSSFPVSGELTVNGETHNYSYGPHIVVSSPLTFPLTGIVARFKVSGVDVSVNVNGTYATIQNFCDAFNAAGSAITAARFADRSDRFILSCNSAFIVTMLDESSHPKAIGLSLGSSDTTLNIEQACSMLNSWFSTFFSAQRDADGNLKIVSISDDPGIALNLTIPGFPTQLEASSNIVTFYGSINGVDIDPISLVGILTPGDKLLIGSTEVAITDINNEEVKIKVSVPTFDSSIEFKSAVVESYKALSSKVDVFIEQFATTSFYEDLHVLEPLVASVDAKKSALLGQLTALKIQIIDLVDRLISNSTLLPTGAGAVERDILNGILSTLEERKFDRAVDLLIKCEFQEFLLLTSDSASYSNYMLTAASNIATSDLIKRNIALDNS